MTQETTRHISQQFDADLAALRNHFLAMGGLVEQQLQNAIQALVESDSALAEQVRVRDKEVDTLETTIDAECTQVIALRQPTASDLRLVLSVVRMVSDLERIGDESKKIAKFALAMSEQGQAPRGYVEIRHIGQDVARMVRDALDSFTRLDAELALAVVKEDKVVDSEYKSATRSLVTFMMEDPRSISQILNVMWVLRSLERAGDHARNIAEHVIYMVKGADVRHSPVEHTERLIEGR